MNQTAFVLLLSEVPGVGDATLGSILRGNAVFRRTPEEFLSLNSDQIVTEYKIRKSVADKMTRFTPEIKSAAIASALSLSRANVELVTLLDATYPQRLLDVMSEPPSALYLYGNRSILDVATFAVANSNGAPESALAAGDECAEKAIAAGETLVTGHNRIQYQRPALVAKREGGRTCYILDRGILEAFDGDLSKGLFPAARIWSPDFDSYRDLAISMFAPRDHSIATHNRKRDEVIFALADTIYSVWLSPGGQMERRCREMREQGKTILPVNMETSISAPEAKI